MYRIKNYINWRWIKDDSMHRKTDVKENHSEYEV